MYVDIVISNVFNLNKHFYLFLFLLVYRMEYGSDICSVENGVRV